MALGAKLGRDTAGGLDLDPVTLILVDRERKQPEPLLLRDRARHHGIEASREQDDGDGGRIVHRRAASPTAGGTQPGGAPKERAALLRRPS